MSSKLLTNLLIEGGVVRIGFQKNTPPFSYSVEENFVPIGYSVEIAKSVIASLAQFFDVNIEIENIEVTSSNREKMLINGEIDIECGSTTITPNRQKKFLFSRSIFNTKHRIAVKKSTDINLLHTGINITGISNSTSYESLRELGSFENQIKFIGFPSIGDVFNNFLVNHDINGIVADEIILKALLQSTEGIEAILLPQSLGKEDYGFMFRKEDNFFVEKVNKEIDDFFNNKGFVDFYKKWIVD